MSARAAEPTVAPRRPRRGIRRTDAQEKRRTHLTRLVSCLAIGIVLALMVGSQEGTQTDFGYAFRKAVFAPRIVIFLVVGVLLYLAVTFWPVLKAYLTRPGVRPLGAGLLTVIASLQLLNWTDSPDVSGGRFAKLASAAADTGGLDPLARAFYGSVVPGTAWILLIVAVVLVGTCIRLNQPLLGYAGGVLAVLCGLWAIYAQAAVRSYLPTPDHSTGGAVGMLGFFAIGASGLVAARTQDREASTTRFLDRVLSWRPGMLLVGIGLVVGLVSLLSAAWFSPLDRNASIRTTSTMFEGTGLGGFSAAYLAWLAYVLFAVVLVLAAAASYLRRADLGWATAALGVVATAITLYVLHDFGGVAAARKFDGAAGAWDNLGTGGWMMCAALTLLAGAGYMVVQDTRSDALSAADSGSTSRAARRARAAEDRRLLNGRHAQTQAGLALLVVVTAVALFYPPTATLYWQTVLVTEIGLYVLLAVGLNVVVGWAGLLDLGFIAFFAIGSYTTAFFTGNLPVHPPHWLVLSPLLAIPFAIVVCLLAGLALGAPTLRLRGDYLAIVTMGFGEIIRVVANNSTSVTNGPRGAFNIPPPEIKLGPIDLTWGNDPLGYWYLLLVLTGIVVFLFTRLEHSRLGRAWAAVREDEVAAQATGINTVRVKLLAFAIGASTSGVAGVFYASQIGSFTPEAFTLQTSILIVAYVVFGGMGSLPGAIAGAAVLNWLPEFLRNQVPAEDRQMWIGAIILLMMIFRPAGLIPARRRRAELGGLDKVASSETSAVPASEGM